MLQSKTSNNKSEKLINDTKVDEVLLTTEENNINKVDKADLRIITIELKHYENIVSY